jgi:hypothetical protein
MLKFALLLLQFCNSLGTQSANNMVKVFNFFIATFLFGKSGHRHFGFYLEFFQFVVWMASNAGSKYKIFL